MVRVSFGRFVRDHRLLMLMTQEELADAVGRDQTYISQLERDRIKGLPQPAFFQRLCSVLQVSPTEPLRAIGYLPDEPAEEANTELARYARLLREIDQLDLPEHLRDLLRKDVEFVRRRAAAERSGDAASERSRDGCSP